ncbi:hypothetical protein D3C84_848150 [compost metagenome]
MSLNVTSNRLVDERSSLWTGNPDVGSVQKLLNHIPDTARSGNHLLRQVIHLTFTVPANDRLVQDPVHGLEVTVVDLVQMETLFVEDQERRIVAIMHGIRREPEVRRLGNRL